MRLDTASTAGLNLFQERNKKEKLIGAANEKCLHTSFALLASKKTSSPLLQETQDFLYVHRNLCNIQSTVFVQASTHCL